MFCYTENVFTKGFIDVKMQDEREKKKRADENTKHERKSVL